MERREVSGTKTDGGVTTLDGHVDVRVNGRDNGRRTADRTVVEPVHVVALSGCHTAEAKVRYACEHIRPDSSVASVVAWLARYGVATTAAFVAPIVAQWRGENDLADQSAAVTPAPRLAGAAQTEPEASDTSSDGPAGAFGFYVVAVMAMLVSIDTSWRYFEHELGITDLRERIVMFAVIEFALVACGYGMRANVVRHGRPGAPRLFAWALCGLAAYMAWQLSGLAEGIARVALGPVLSLVMLHLALGIEIRARQDEQTTTWVRIGREMRERVLSRIGLANDERDAVARTRDRAARRAARLALAKRSPLRSVRLARALRTSNVAHDPTARDRMLTELAAVRHADDLADLDQPSPWGPVNTAVEGPVNTTLDGPVDGVVNGQGAAADRPVNGPTGRARTSRARPSERRTARTSTTRTSTTRRPLADYVTAATEHLTPDVEVTPAWVRDVLPGCPRSTSKNVADALKAQQREHRKENA